MKFSNAPFSAIFLSLCFAVASAAPAALSQEMLGDPGFEMSIPNGSFPSSGEWQPGWHPQQAGALCTSTAAHSGFAGLWTYTASTSLFSWAGTYQEFSASPGQTAVASAYIRTPPPGEWVKWVAGSKALVRIEFLDAASQVLAFYDSPGVTVANSGWGFYSITTNAAPAGTAKVRYRAYVEKPAGPTGQSVANFDDCSLALITNEVPELYVSPAALGLRNNQTSRTFKVKNAGTGTLEWSLSKTAAWITSITPASGSLSEGREQLVTVNVSRTGLSGSSFESEISFASNGGSDSISVFMDMPGFLVPAQASITKANGYQLLVQKRLQNGSLDLPKPYVVKGVAWSPVGLGDSGDITNRRNAFRDWYVADVQLMKKAGINTVYTFIDMWADARGLEVLDNLYKNGIMAIVTVDEDGTNNTIILDQVVRAYRNHPAILMWALGNEWNILRPDVSKYYKKFDTREEAARAMQAAALQVKSLDSNHAVASILGEIVMPDQPLALTAGIVNNVCSAVDVWGANIYRGDNFGGVGANNLFTQWGSIARKPLFLSEYGTDAYRTTQHWNPTLGHVDEPMQADWNHGLWAEIESNLSAGHSGKVCLGGTVFEWIDEWWKTRVENGGSPDVHDNLGFETTWNYAAHPDGFANEEYFGMLDIDRRVRASYLRYKSDYSKQYNLLAFGTIYQKPAADLIPLEGASISILDISRTNVLASTLTDASGKFWVMSNTIPDGTYIIRTSKDSYETYSGMTTLRKHAPLPFSVTLHPPVMDALPEMTVGETEMLSLPLSATDPNRDRLAFNAAFLPKGASFHDNDNNSAELRWVPSTVQAGSYTVSISVTDGFFTRTQEARIHVVNSPTVRGTVRDQLTKAAIANAAVRLSGNRPRAQFKAITNELGEFMFNEDFPTGIYHLFIRRAGYVPYARAIKLVSGRSLQNIFFMNRTRKGKPSL